MSYQERSIQNDERMSYQEKRAIVELISTIVISAAYFLYASQRFPEGSAYSREVFRFWGTTILILLPVSMVAKLIIHIAFSILNTIATNEKEPGFVDERDKLIELKAMRNSLYVLMVGFVPSLGSLAFDAEPSVMFMLLIGSGIVAEVVGELSQLYYYRRGV